MQKNHWFSFHADGEDVPPVTAYAAAEVDRTYESSQSKEVVGHVGQMLSQPVESVAHKMPSPKSEQRNQNTGTSIYQADAILGIQKSMSEYVPKFVFKWQPQPLARKNDWVL